MISTGEQMMGPMRLDLAMGRIEDGLAVRAGDSRSKVDMKKKEEEEWERKNLAALYTQV